MNNRIITSILTATLLLLFASCSNDLSQERNNTAGDVEGRHVSIKINGLTAAKTRTAPTAIAREDALDNDKMFAVVFDVNNQNGKAYKLTYHSESTSYDFNIDAAGHYYMYVVANTTAITDGDTYATPADLLAVKETKALGEDGTSTNFLMTSEKLQLDIDGTNATTANITLKRAVARIDVGCFAGFTITNITVTNRYTNTLIGRTITGAITMENDLAKSATQSYSITANAGDAVEGLVYAYENLSSAEADQMEISVTGTHMGEPKTVTAKLALVERNKAYRLNVTETDGDNIDYLQSTISVADWTPGAELTYNSLINNDTPEIYLTTADYANVDGGEVVSTETKNPTAISILPSTAKTVNLRVVGTKVGSSVLSNDVGAPVATLVSTGHDDAGHIVQNFTISIDADDMTKADSKFTYHAYNQVVGEATSQDLDIIVKVDVGYIMYSDGSLTPTYNATHATAHSVTPIAMVFSATPTTYDKNLGYTHGYAMALKRANAGNNVANWSTSSTEITDKRIDSGTNTADYWNSITGDMDGLQHCNTAYTNNGNSYTGLTAIAAAHNYTPAAPSGTSGWYLPSIGQQHKWLIEFAKSYPSYSIINDRTKWTFRPEDNTHDYYINNGTYVNASSLIASAINTYASTQLGDVKTTYWEDFAQGHYLWSSTERTGSYPFYLFFFPSGYLYLNGNADKSNAYLQVRAVLAF